MLMRRRRNTRRRLPLRRRSEFSSDGEVLFDRSMIWGFREESFVNYHCTSTAALLFARLQCVAVACVLPCVCVDTYAMRGVVVID